MTKDTLPGTSGIVTVAATEEEMQTAIEALLTLGSDMPAADAELDENAALVSLAPQHLTRDLHHSQLMEIRQNPK